VFCYTGDFDPVRRWWRRDTVASGFSALAKAVREKGGKTICMIDNNRKRTVRQAVGGAVFRFVLREHRNIDAVFVPGIDGGRLMGQFGFSERKIRKGLYGADPEIFRPGPPLDQRPRDFLFVGQLIERKGIVTLLQAVEKLRAESINCGLAALGSGPMEAAVRSAGIPVLGFCPPDLVAEEMRKTKFLVLPSYEEHWGVVVHEAALSGCGLILSDAIGSRHDLLTAENGFLCKVRDSASLACAMRFALSLKNAELDRCRRVSVDVAADFGPERFAETLRETVETLMRTDDVRHA
jgi:glycosyltransferase involved in cell wall biosynthesis